MIAALDPHQFAVGVLVGVAIWIVVYAIRTLLSL